MILSVGFTFALGVLFPVLMNYFDENREKTGECVLYCIGLAWNFDVTEDILP